MDSDNKNSKIDINNGLNSDNLSKMQSNKNKFNITLGKKLELLPIIHKSKQSDTREKKDNNQILPKIGVKEEINQNT